MAKNLMKKARKLASVMLVRSWRNAFIRHRVAASIEHRRILANLGNFRTVVDIGANRGQFALAARDAFPDANIFSFEPLKGPAQVFSRVFKDDPRVSLFNAAIGPKSGEALIHVSARDDSSSLLPISENQTQLFSGTQEVATDRVKIDRLGNLIEAFQVVEPALLKLDVQGYELEALKGAESLIHLFSFVYAECSFVELYKGQDFADEVIRWLAAREFRLSGCYNMAYDKHGKAVQADFLFTRAPAA